MAVVEFEIIRREPYAANEDFGGSGPYERIDAIAHYAVDTSLPGNDRITDLSLAERKDGKVNFTGDATLLVPRGKANRALLVNFPNRGNRRPRGSSTGRPLSWSLRTRSIPAMAS